MTISWAIEVLGNATSTQILAMDAAAKGAAEGTVFQAMSQSAGKGRHGNQWDSPMGNLYMSLILRPMCRPDLAGQVSFVIGLAVSAAIGPYLSGQKKTLKWPNDILIDGRKCAGILLESQMTSDGIVDALIVGTGVNIMAPPEGRVGLKELAGERRLAIHRFRDEVLAQIADYYEGWKLKGFEPVREEWLKQAHGLGHTISARLPDRTEKGIFRGIDADGALLLEAEKGKEIAIRAGDVYFGA